MAFGGTSFAGATVFLPSENGIQAIVVSCSGTFLPVGQTKSGANGPPVLGGGCVFTADTSTGVLYALGRSSGAVVARVALGAVPHLRSPTTIGRPFFVGTDGGAVGISGG